MSTKEQLRDKIKRDLGYPLVKVELFDSTIDDAIDDAATEYRTWTIGNATQEVYFTQILSSGEWLYDLPTGVVSVVDYETSGSTQGINTLFTLENYLYNKGVLDPWKMFQGNNHTMIAYHMALDFLDTVDRYTTSKYTFRYMSDRNQLQITPTPSGDSLTITRDDGSTYTSPGFILLRSYMLEGASLGDTEWNVNEWYNWIYDKQWIRRYARALCKEKLGITRRKFSNFQSIGNTGLSLDGSDLISEGKEEQEKLLEELRERDFDTYEGFGIIIG